MSDDLISRKELLKFLRNWQMELKGVEHKREYNLVDRFIKGVENQPIAYDVDKVVEQLHNAGGCDGSCEYAKGWDDAMEEAEKIVKAAGHEPAVNEEWKEHITRRFDRVE